MTSELVADTTVVLSQEELFRSLAEALPFIAAVTGGYATITDRQGVRLITVNSRGEELEEMVGKRFQALDNSTLPSITTSDFEIEAQSWVLPMGPYVIACSNIERIEMEKHFFAGMAQALPTISKLVGGESILFDKNGRRLVIYDYEGKVATDTLGKVSTAAAEAMRTKSPTVGSSMSITGAVAVRFPLTENFGFGFNNVQSVQRERRLLDEVRKRKITRYSLLDIVGDSPSITNTKKLAEKLAASCSSILIFGETGTGKELFAQAIHNESPVNQKPFVAINCGALPASLIESYLFGYEHGSFTGAKKGGDSGAFENANGGTLFLDEISEMEFTLQSKILRVLQEREIVRIGGSQTIPINIRVLASTNRNLWEMVQNGEFRADLYYRLNIVELVIPPLRERSGDVISLVNVFIHKNNQLFGCCVLSVSDQAASILTAHSWPGNVRELQNCVEYAFNIMPPQTWQLLPEHLPPYLTSDAGIVPAKAGTVVASSETEQALTFLPLREVVARAERKHIMSVLELHNNSKQKAAQALDISQPTLWRKMKELEIP